MNPDIWQLLGIHFSLEQILLPLAILVLLFILFRELLTWYWKLNRIVNLLEKIEENTRKTEVTKIAEEKEAPHTDALGIKN